MLTRDTAAKMAATYREIEAAEKLIEEVEKELEKADKPDFYGEMKPAGRNCQLGWPSDGGSYRLFMVEPRIASAVIMAHLANLRANLEKLNQVASLEISGQAAT